VDSTPPPSPRPSPSREREKTGRDHNVGLSPLLGERVRVRTFTRRKEDKRFPLSPALSRKGEGENRT